MAGWPTGGNRKANEERPVATRKHKVNVEPNICVKLQSVVKFVNGVDDKFAKGCAGARSCANIMVCRFSILSNVWFVLRYVDTLVLPNM